MGRWCGLTWWTADMREAILELFVRGVDCQKGSTCRGGFWLFRDAAAVDCAVGEARAIVVGGRAGKMSNERRGEVQRGERADEVSSLRRNAELVVLEMKVCAPGDGCLSQLSAGDRRESQRREREREERCRRVFASSVRSRLMGETERAAPRPRLPHAAAIDPSMATTARQVKCGFRLSGKSFPATEMARKARLTGLMMPLSKVQDSRIGSVPPYLPPTTPNPAFSRRMIMPFFLSFTLIE